MHISNYPYPVCILIVIQKFLIIRRIVYRVYLMLHVYYIVFYTRTYSEYILYSWRMLLLAKKFIKFNFLAVMNNEHSLAEKTVVDLLDKFESKKYQELIESAWNVLYTVIIPFNIEGIHLLLSNYIIILSQALSIESIEDEATRILSVIDLIIHPRKGTIIEGKNEFDDIINEPVEAPSPDKNNDSLDSDKTKKVKISIIE